MSKKPVEYKALRFELKAVNDNGTIEGYGATWDLDQGGDIIKRGAFSKTINERVAAGKVKLLDSHRWDATSTLGKILSAEEDDKGLYITAQFASTQDAQDMRTKVAEGMLDSFSIGYVPIKASYGEENGEPVRYIEEIKLYEVSIVAFPMNEAATVSAVKSLDELIEDYKAGRRNSGNDSQSIKTSISTLYNLLDEDDQKDLLKSLAPDESSEVGPTKALKTRLESLEEQLNLF